MIELLKECMGTDSYMIRLRVLGDTSYDRVLMTLPDIKALPQREYLLPYTKLAYNNFQRLHLPFRTKTSNSSHTSGHTDSTSIGDSRTTAHSSIEDNKSSVAIDKTVERWKSSTEVTLRAGVFVVNIPYRPAAVAWVKGLEKAYWSKENRCWVAKGSLHNLSSIQEGLQIYSAEQYEQVADMIKAAQNPKRLEIWRSPAEKDLVYLKATGIGIDLEPIKRIPSRTYDKQYKRWTIPYDAAMIDRLVKYYVSNDTKVDYRLKESGQVYTKEVHTYAVTVDKLLSKADPKYGPWLKKYADTMAAQRYSHASIRQYLGKFLRFLEYNQGQSPTALTADAVNGYLTKLSKEKISDSALNQSISALRYYYTKVEYLPDFQIERIRRPRKGQYLPNILSQGEVSKLLEVCQNLKHSSILYTLYSSGIRLSELLAIRIEDLYWDRNQIFVRGGKGKKDRVVQLSHVLKDVLLLYFDTYKPIYWLYEGQDQRTQYSTSSVQKVVRKAAKKAGIQRTVTPHVLRHCYATHLHDGGTSIRYIQELLGHKDIKTTLIYTHVSTQEVSKIESPLDNLMSKKEKKQE